MALAYRERALPLSMCLPQYGGGAGLLPTMLAEVAALIATSSWVVSSQVLCLHLLRNSWLANGVRLDAPIRWSTFFRSIWLTRQRFGPLHLALVHVHTPE